MELKLAEHYTTNLFRAAMLPNIRRRHGRSNVIGDNDDDVGFVLTGGSNSTLAHLAYRVWVERFRLLIFRLDNPFINLEKLFAGYESNIILKEDYRVIRWPRSTTCPPNNKRPLWAKLKMSPRNSLHPSRTRSTSAARKIPSLVSISLASRMSCLWRLRLNVRPPQPLHRREERI